VALVPWVSGLPLRRWSAISGITMAATVTLERPLT